MAFKSAFVRLVTVLSIGLAGCGTRPPAAPGISTLDIRFVSFIQSGLPEQDVFVEPDNRGDDPAAELGTLLESCKSGADLNPNWIPAWGLPPARANPFRVTGIVVRPEPQDARRPTFLARQLYAARKVIPHDPYKLGLNPLGPYRAGDALGLTWREWLIAQGSGTYTVKEGNAELNLSFQNLIPYGTYSLWCGHEPLTASDLSFEEPCDNAGGIQNRLRADQGGNATLTLKIKPLQSGANQGAPILSLSYDRLEPTEDDEFSGYGVSNHVQLFFKFPHELPPVVPGANRPGRQK